MILRFIVDSLRRAPRRKALTIIAIALGSAVATAMLGVMLSIGDKINRELRTAGANIAVTAKSAALTGGIGAVTTATAGAHSYLDEADAPKIKSIFWGLNITGFSPSLSATDATQTLQGVWFHHPYKTPDGIIAQTGLTDVNPTWNLTAGHWPSDDATTELIAGQGAARRNNWQLGQKLTLFNQPFEISGILATGDETDDRLLLPLARLQQLASLPGKIDRIEVSAITKPEDDFARKDPRTMTSAELERWSCTNYVSVIAKQIADVIPNSEARAVRRVADSEGKILDKVSGLMGLITLAALLSAGLTVWSLTATTMMERRGEVAIMQAIGATRAIIGVLLGAEVAVIGLAGGAIGAFAGVALAHFVGESVFRDAVEISWILPFVIMLAAALVSLAGAWQPLSRALRLDPALILREGV
jgi:putative ABC transport system permease protein